MTVSGVWGEFALALLIIAIAGSRLARYGDIIGIRTGLGGTWIGLMLIATVTSLPEVVVTVAALRLGAVNMAMSNVFGSNLFNILVLAPEDLLFTPGPILASVSPLHAFSAAAAMLMSLVAILALRHPPRRRLLGTFGWASCLLLAIYLLTAYVLFLNGH